MTAAVVTSYRPLTEEAAARIAAKFRISERGRDLFEIVSGVTTAYEKFLHQPDLKQIRNGLENLDKRILATISAIEQFEPDDIALFDGVLRRLGELLTYTGMESLLNKALPRGLPSTPADSIDSVEMGTMSIRSALAIKAGPKILTQLLTEMHDTIADSLVLLHRNRGGRPPKHLLRRVLVQELGRCHEFLFSRRPTPTWGGSFANFCCEILAEMEISLEGIEKNIEVAMKTG